MHLQEYTSVLQSCLSSLQPQRDDNDDTKVRMHCLLHEALRLRIQFLKGQHVKLQRDESQSRGDSMKLSRPVSAFKSGAADLLVRLLHIHTLHHISLSSHISCAADAIASCRAVCLEEASDRNETVWLLMRLSRC